MRRTVCLLSATRIEDDPRLCRQGDALADAGYEVVAIGLPGSSSPAPAWPIVHVAGQRRNTWGNLGIAIRQVPARGPLATWGFTSQAWVRRFTSAAVAVGADLYVANDWRMLPSAAAAAAAGGVPYCFDSHELGPEEFAERAAWRLTFAHVADQVERRWAHRAAFVSTVSEGLAQAIQDRYDLPRKPLVIRSTPAYQPPDDHAVELPLKVLYHGQFLPNRGLEALIDSVGSWRADRHLVLRGFGPPAYERSLRDRAAHLGSRVVFDDPVPMKQLVAAARGADVGIHPLLDLSSQTRFSLPNKIFEYVMAGLAVVVSDLPELARLVRHYDLGITMAQVDPSAIAASVNGLDVVAIERFRANARRAAADLCWERERSIFLAAVAEALPPGV